MEMVIFPKADKNKKTRPMTGTTKISFMLARDEVGFFVIIIILFFISDGFEKLLVRVKEFVLKT